MGLSFFLFCFVLLMIINDIRRISKNKGNPHFDERQIYIRSKVYTDGNILLYAYFFGLFIYYFVFGDPAIGWPIALLIGLTVGDTFTNSCLIWKDAMYPVNEKPIFEGTRRVFFGFIKIAFYFLSMDVFSTYDKIKTMCVLLILSQGIEDVWTGTLYLIKKWIAKQSEPSE